MQSLRIIHKSWVVAWSLRIALVLNLSLSISYIMLWGMLLLQGMFWRADFSAYYTGWMIARDGLGDRLYDFVVQASYQQHILEGRSFAGGLLPYLNPPHATIVFVPLTLLPLNIALWVWSLLQVVVLIWLIRLLLFLARDWEAQERWLMLSTVVAFPPLLLTFQLGTFSLFMLLCLLQYYVALKHERNEAAGLWLFLGSVKPQVLLLPGLLLIAGRRWRALSTTLLAGFAAAAIASLLLGWQSWIGFLNALRTVNTFYGIAGIVPATMYNFKGTLALILGNAQGAFITQVSLLAFMLAAWLVLWLWRGPWRIHDASFELRMALTMLLGLLFNPHLYRHDGLMFVAPAIFFYIYLRRHQLPRRAFAVWALSSPLIVLISEFTFGGSLGIRVPVVLMIVLGWWICRALIVEQRAPARVIPVP